MASRTEMATTIAINSFPLYISLNLTEKCTLLFFDFDEYVRRYGNMS